MSIYTPYTYLIGWSSLNKFYYGRRTAKGCNPTDLWTKYFTSSKVVKEYRKLHGEPDIIQIRQTFCDTKKCAQWESKVLERIDAQHNIKYLNQKNGDNKWDTTGIHFEMSDKHKKKLSERMKGNLNPNYQAFGNKNTFFGKKHSEETRLKMRKPKANYNKEDYLYNTSCKPIIAIHLDTGIETIFRSIMECVRELNISCVKLVLNGKQKSSKGYSFRYTQSILE